MDKSTKNGNKKTSGRGGFPEGRKVSGYLTALYPCISANEGHPNFSMEFNQGNIRL